MSQESPAVAPALASPPLFKGDVDCKRLDDDINRPLESFPTDPESWAIPGLRGAARLADSFTQNRDDALLFKRLATLVVDGPDVGAPDEWEWHGPRPAFADWSARLESPGWIERVTDLVAARSGG